MWVGVAFLLIVKLVTALGEDANGPRCQELPACSQDECRQCDLSGSELSLLETDVAGRFRANLLAQHGCRVERLDVMLHQCDVSHSMCTNSMESDLKSHHRIHSQQTFLCDREDSENTIKVLSSEDIKNQKSPQVNLTYDMEMVYSGCYMLEYVITYNTSYSHRIIQFTWVQKQNNTEYNLTQDEFEYRLSDSKILSNVISPNHSLTLILQYKVPRNEYNVQVYNQIWPDNVQITLQDRNTKDYCTVVYINGESRVKCYMPKDFGPGNYTLVFSLYTGFCNGYIFNNTLCRIQNNFHIVDPQIDEGGQMAESHSVDLLSIIGGILCIFTILGLAAVTYCHLYKQNILTEHKKDFIRDHFPPAVHSSPVERVVTGIVLVYARDCEPFMKVMVEFRILLEQQCRVKVYDIFDVALFNSEICKAPQDWARAKLLTPGVKFILVKTRCGELLYEPIVVSDDRGLHLETPLLKSTGYRTPRYTDDLVQTLFRLVRDDAMLPNSYHKYFVVQVSQFSGNRQFVHVNPYRRYELPSTVKVLVSHILNQPQVSYQLGEPEQRLEAAVNSLREYLTHNKDYLCDIVDLVDGE